MERKVNIVQDDGCRDLYWFECPDPEDASRPNIRMPDHHMVLMVLLAYAPAEVVFPHVFNGGLPDPEIIKGELYLNLRDGTKKIKVNDDQLHAVIKRDIKLAREGANLSN